MTERGDERCCALVADCDCYKCQAAKGEPSLLEQMTEARDELLRDIRQNLLPQIKAQAAELSRIRTLLSDTVEPHLKELRDAFERGALSSSDGKNGTRSIRNADVLVKLRSYLLGSAESEKGTNE